MQSFACMREKIFVQTLPYIHLEDLLKVMKYLFFHDTFSILRPTQEATNVFVLFLTQSMHTDFYSRFRDLDFCRWKMPFFRLLGKN